MFFKKYELVVIFHFFIISNDSFSFNFIDPIFYSNLEVSNNLSIKSTNLLAYGFGGIQETVGPKKTFLNSLSAFFLML